MSDVNYVIKSIEYIGLTTACIVDLINNNQKIKRYCRYKSKTPLSPIGIIGNNRIPQPNISTDLDETTYNSKGEVESKPVLFDCMFDPDMQTELDVGIYVYDYSTKFSNNLGKCLISVDVIIPYNYEYLQPKGDKRSILITSEIINTLCTKPITKDTNKYWFDLLGNVNFSFKDLSNGRLSLKNNSIRRTIIFETTLCTNKLIGDMYD